jgi:putative transposase
VRAQGAVDLPVQWEQSRFSEIQQTPKRYRLIDLPAVIALRGFAKSSDSQQAHRQWVDDALHGALTRRDRRWTQALASGCLAAIEKVRSELGPKHSTGNALKMIRSESKIENPKLIR